MILLSNPLKHSNRDFLILKIQEWVLLFMIGLHKQERILRESKKIRDLLMFLSQIILTVLDMAKVSASNIE